MIQGGPCLLTWYDPALGGINGGGQYADGGTYHGNDMACAADLSYPFGTNIQFFANGRSVTVKVRDRGGAITGTHFDLTTGASSKLTGGAPSTINGTFKVVNGGGGSLISNILDTVFGGPTKATQNAYKTEKGVVSSAGSTVADVGKAIGFVFSVSGMDRILKIIGGGVMVLIAINELIKSTGAPSPASLMSKIPSSKVPTPLPKVTP